MNETTPGSSKESYFAQKFIQHTGECTLCELTTLVLEFSSDCVTFVHDFISR